MNKVKYEEHLKEIVIAFMLPTIVFFIYDTQLRIFKYDSGLWLYLLLCIGECGLSIIIRRKEK